MVRSRSIVICLTLAVAAGLGAAGALAKPHAKPSPIGIRASERLVEYTRSVALTGRLASGRANVSVTLQARRFGQKAFHDLARSATGTGGRYGFLAGPKLATSYRVTLTHRSVKSRTVTVYVAPLVIATTCNFCVPSPPNGKHTLRVSFRYEVPASAFAVEAAKRVYFYYGAAQGGPVSKESLIRTVAQSARKHDQIDGKVSHRVDFGPGLRFQYNLCTLDSESSDGMGLPGHHHCGDATLTRRQFDSYLG